MFNSNKLLFISSALLIISATNTSAQELNSLIERWKESTVHDTAFINLSNDIAGELNYTSAFDSALVFADSALRVSIRLGYREGEAEAKIITGEINISKSNFVKALDYILQARTLFESLSNEEGIADCNLQTGIIYHSQKKYSLAISYFRQADSIYTKLNDRKHSSTARYLEARCLLELKQYSQAEKLLLQAEEMKSELGLQRARYECHWGLADLYLQTGQTEKAKLYYGQCLQFFQSEKNKEGIASMQYSLGKVYSTLSKNDSAEIYFLKALEESKHANHLQVMVSSAQALSQLYADEGDFKKAFRYQSEYYSSRDSLYSEETAQKISNMQAEFNIAKANSEIDLLNQKRSNDRILFYLLLSCIGLLIILVVGAFQRYRFKQRTNKQLQQANDDLQLVLQNLKDMQNKLILSEKLASLGQLTAGIAHEINNPINFVSSSINPLKKNFSEVKRVIEAYEELLSQTGEKDSAEQLKEKLNLEENLSESEDLLDGIEEGSRRTAEIVRGLRNFSRMDIENKKKVNINDGIESTLSLLQNKLMRLNIDVVKSYNLVPLIDGYPGQLNQVFMNLFTNAIDAIGTKGKILISTYQENNSVKISFRDTGSGMTDEVKEKIFDPFFTTKDVGKGTGLGMSISYGIIEKHNGTIEVNSEVGKGTEFIITLPINEK